MFSGKVIHGDGLGKEFGCATANLDITPAKTQLREGVYAGHAWLNRERYFSAISIHHAQNKVEVHLLDYIGKDFYGSLLSVEAVQQVSQMESLDSINELKEKIQQDLRMIREVLNQKE